MHGFTSTFMLMATLPIFQAGLLPKKSQLTLFLFLTKNCSLFTGMASECLQMVIASWDTDLQNNESAEGSTNLNSEQLRNERIILISVDLVLPRWYIVDANLGSSGLFCCPVKGALFAVMRRNFDFQHRFIRTNTN